MFESRPPDPRSSEPLDSRQSANEQYRWRAHRPPTRLAVVGCTLAAIALAAITGTASAIPGDPIDGRPDSHPPSVGASARPLLVAPEQRDAVDPVATIRAVGQRFAAPPDHLRTLLETPGEPSLDAIQSHLESHDLVAAGWEAERYTDTHRWGRSRDAAWMVQGMLHRERGEYNLASAAFTKVRTGKGPLETWGAYYEAEQDLKRGKYWVAARECKTYREKWPTGRHSEDCHRLMAVAYAKAGAWSKSREIAEEYDDNHRRGPISEQIELTLTLGALADTDDPASLIPRLQRHAVEFTAPLTGRIAAEKLAELQADGFDEAVVPQDLWSRKALAYSLRDTKQTDAAWEVFSGLILDSDDDRGLQRWIVDEAERFGWRARKWSFLAEYYDAEYQKSPRAETAWRQYRVLTRGGRYDDAIDVYETLGVKHGSSVHWRRKQEDIGRTYMLAGDYVGAREQFDKMARRGGWTGRRGRFYAAFAGVMAADDDEDTLERLTTIIDAERTYAFEATYWRARLYDRMEKPDLALLDRQVVIATDPHSWYGILAAQQIRGQLDDEARSAFHERDGRWVGPPELAPPQFVGDVPRATRAPSSIVQPFSPRPTAANAGFSMVQWDPQPPDPTPQPRTFVISRDPDLPPPSYASGELFPKDDIKADFRRWADRNSKAWPELQAAYDLSRVGLYDLSGPLFSAIYEEWRKAYRYSGNRRHAAARSMKLDANGWRGVFNYVRDHHHTARFNHSAWESIEDPELARASRTLGYPLAHDRMVWTHARDSGIDPYLVLGLMRQESTYNSIARSPVGASGAMQIMPTTGHLLANLQHDVLFNAGDLEDPLLSISYGITYLGLLMERFDGAYPLAIASYNGGPFNVSTWRSATGDDMPMDAFVEHIPFRETRDYVKKVSAGYATYLTLYADEDTVLAPPPFPRSDDPSVVDF